ncbi:hypothetical protein F5883DRAFT_654252 [Diaporthe sp. PMI_573]|nr:hypothetical protein F5883DRAFT_654252 [Diaporthaceae sp. PMI_573]
MSSLKKINGPQVGESAPDRYETKLSIGSTTVMAQGSGKVATWNGTGGHGVVQVQVEIEVQVEKHVARPRPRISRK